jgi:polysaccharide export outer membrane protein
MKRPFLIVAILSLFIFTCSCATTGGIPAANLPSAPKDTEKYQHRVEPGDIIEVSIWEADGLKNYESQVSREGTINLMFIENIPVIGLTEKELDEKITKELKIYYVDPNVSVKIKEIVYVLGESEAPGAYNFENGLTLASIIASSGGPTKEAKLKNVVVIRDYNTNPQVIVSDFSRMLKKGDMTQNIILKGGDIVYLPSSGISDVKFFAEQLLPIIDLIFTPTRVTPLTP